MPKYAARVDANHLDITRGLRDVGGSVQSLAPVGRGCPDALVGVAGLTLVGRFNADEIRWLLRREDVVIHDGANLLMEIKNPNVDKAHQRLTADEEKWHSGWVGQLCIVRTIEEALHVAGAIGL